MSGLKEVNKIKIAEKGLIQKSEVCEVLRTQSEISDVN